MIFDFEELSFQIMSVNKVNNLRGIFKVDGRPYAALSYRLSGSGRFVCNGKSFISSPGDLLFIPDGASYEVEYSGGAIIVVHFFDCNYRTVENCVLSNKDYVGLIFEEMFEMWKTSRMVNGIKSDIYKIMQTCSEHYSSIPEDHLVFAAKSLIDKGFSAVDFSIDSIADKLYTSRATLRRRFVSAVGMPPKQYLLKVRLCAAIDMLSQGEHSVKEVSERCGFGDEKYFSRLIKERYGKTPSEISGIM